MKVIKRDGRIVDFDRAKIHTGIAKANEEVKLTERATKENIKEIIYHIEGLNKKRMLAEDIQDIVEEKLMELGKFKLAKRYMIYKYTNDSVEKQNTADETIFGIILNEDQKEENSNRIFAAI